MLVTNIIVRVCVCSYFNAERTKFLGKGAIQVLRNADGGGGVSGFLEKSVTKV